MPLETHLQKLVRLVEHQNLGARRGRAGRQVEVWKWSMRGDAGVGSRKAPTR